jgi:hypothetical protein
LIYIEIQELSKGFNVIQYFDDNQPRQMDEQNVYCESWEDVVKYLGAKVVKTLDSRKKEKA